MQVFKYIMLYALMQSFTVCVLYLLNATLGDWQFLWEDLFIVLPLSVFSTSLSLCHC